MRHSTAFAALLALTPLGAAPALSQGLLDADVIKVEVMPGWRENGMGHIAALRMTLEPGWKTYWRAPGDAGIPPMFNWSGSQNVQSVTPHFPVPEIFNQNGMRSIGYQDEVIIPLHITRRDANEPIELNAELEIGVCEEICIPAMVSFTATLPMQGASNGDISAALADAPMTEAEARVGEVTCQISPLDDGLALTLEVDMPPIGDTEEAAIETADPAVWVAEPSVTRNGNTLRAETQLVRYGDGPFALDRSGVRMTVFGADEAVDILGCSAG
ncbi:MAG: protein-disulfide reductase DsbD domain-containing protein [Pseudomonadota bacterium]